MGSFLRGLLATAFLLTFIVYPTWGQQGVEWNETDNLPRWLTEAEKLRLHEIGLNFRSSDAFDGEVRNIAEFERMEGVLIRFPLGIPLNLVAAMSQHAKVYTLVADANRLNQATNSFTNGQVNMDNVFFIIAPTNSIWTRDYGPWFVATEDKKIEVVDFIYNRPRQFDNAIPSVVADYLDIPLRGMPLVHCGGNYMSDSYNTGASTDLVIEENSHDEGRVLGLTYDFLGVDHYIITEDAQGDYIRHIDTWAKFLDVDKILIAQVPEINPRYAVYEEIAEYYSQQMSAYGTPFQVYRVFSPNGQPYTNSLILNERVYVPITGSAWDDVALETYRTAMPGYEVLGFTGQWISTDALHCRVKDIADRNMLYIGHKPLHVVQMYADSFLVEATIIPYSGAALLEDECKLYYSLNEGPIDSLILNGEGDDLFQAYIPITPGDTIVHYYLRAEDASGRVETWPLVGAAAARSFRVQYRPILSFFPDVLSIETDAWQYATLLNETAVSIRVDSITTQSGDLFWQLDSSWVSQSSLASGASLDIPFRVKEGFETAQDMYIDSIFVWSSGVSFMLTLIYEPLSTSTSEPRATASEISVFPNPFTTEIFWKSELSSNKGYRVLLTDASGQMVVQEIVESMNASPLQGNILPPIGLAPGVYMLQLIIDGTTYSVPVLKL